MTVNHPGGQRDVPSIRFRPLLAEGVIDQRAIVVRVLGDAAQQRLLGR